MIRATGHAEGGVSSGLVEIACPVCRVRRAPDEPELSDVLPDEGRGTCRRQVVSRIAARRVETPDRAQVRMAAGRKRTAPEGRTTSTGGEA